MQNSPRRFAAVVYFNSEIESALSAGKSFQNIYGVKPYYFCNNPEARDSFARLQGVEAHVGYAYVGHLRKIEKSDQPPNPEERLDCLLGFLNTMASVFRLIRNDYLLFLHPDHRVVRKIPSRKLVFDYEQQSVNLYDEKDLMAFEMVFGFKPSLKGYGIHGYSQVEAHRQVVAFLIENRDGLLRKLLTAAPIFVYDDALIPLVFEYLGYSVGCANVTLELKRPKSAWRKIARRFETLHQVQILDKIVD